MKKKRERAVNTAKRYTVTENNGGHQVRLLPTFVVKSGDLVKQFVFDPDVHEPRPGDLIVRKVTIVE